MPGDNDISNEITERVRTAGSALRIVGAGTKEFYGRSAHGEPLAIAAHRGIVSYEPTELVLTARAGTPLTEIEAALAANHQMLAFEPPHFGEGATLGGTLACGFSGPARPYTGSARDFVLGMKIVNGNGEVLSFGGQVMKNVAGYDVSRLMVGALGTLGVLLEASLKILPRPRAELTLQFEFPADRAVKEMNNWAARPLPLSAACHSEDTLYIRLAGSEETVRTAHRKLGGNESKGGGEFWQALREHRLAFFGQPGPLWRLSVPAATSPIDLPGRWLIDWGGAQRWLKTAAPPDQVWSAAQRAGGHATVFRGGDRDGEVFQPLPAPLLELQRKLKRAFDPRGMLNPGRYVSAW